jgi:hypothetical protein
VLQPAENFVNDNKIKSLSSVEMRDSIFEMKAWHFWKDDERKNKHFWSLAWRMNILVKSEK